MYQQQQRAPTNHFSSAAPFAPSGGPSFIDAAREGGVESLKGPFVASETRFDSCLKGMNTVEVDSAKGRVVCELEVTESLANAFGTLHGGATATMIDVVGTLALLALDPSRPGVSVELQTTYIAGAKRGETLVAEGWVNKTGRMLAFTEVSIRTKGDQGRLIATGKHLKAFGGASTKKAK